MAEQPSEIGVILLMFGVGLQFHFQELLAVKPIAIPGAIVQSLVATVCGAVLMHGLGWSWPAGIVFGLAISRHRAHHRGAERRDGPAAPRGGAPGHPRRCDARRDPEAGGRRHGEGAGAERVPGGSECDAFLDRHPNDAEFLSLLLELARV
jgi:hypothetical protein